MLARESAPARLLLGWLGGDFELIISGKSISELRRALSYPKIRTRVSVDERSAFVDLLEGHAFRAIDPDKAPRRSRDPGDDYLLALAESCSAVVVSGDQDLLALKRDLPIYSAAEFPMKMDVA